MKRAALIAQFEASLDTTIVPVLLADGYTLHDYDWGIPSGVRAMVVRTYMKEVWPEAYAHIVLCFDPRARQPTQDFTIQVLRYDDVEPAVARMGPWLSHAWWFLNGYVHPSLPEDSLAFPLIDRNMVNSGWFFPRADGPRPELERAAQRLRNQVLPYLNDASTTQRYVVDIALYREAYQRFVAGEWTAPTAFATIAELVPPDLRPALHAGQVQEADLLVSTVGDILRGHCLHRRAMLNTDFYTPALVAYLGECLDGKRQFRLAEYRSFLSRG